MHSFLIVDDEAVIRKSIVIMLNQSQLQLEKVQEAGDGEIAMSYMMEQAFDFVISDIRMPKMDGLELARRISGRWPKTSILLVSGYNDFSYAQTAIRYGVKDYLLKPVNPKSLVESITRILEIRSGEVDSNYIPINEIEAAINCLDEQLWSGSAAEMENTTERLYQLFEKCKLDYCIRISKEILDVVLRKLSLRMGYTLKIPISDFGGENRRDIKKWVVENLSIIALELARLKKQYDYKMIDVAKKYIEENYNKNISLEDISRKVGLNASYFSQVFKSRTGKTFVDYRSEFRIEKAKELLCRPDKSVAEITYDVGYHDATHFIRTFKKFTGMSPGEFKQKSGVCR